MKMHHKRRYRLKKKYKDVGYIVISFCIVIFMHQSNFLKPIFKLCKDKYLKKEYQLENSNLKSMISKEVFGDEIVINKDDKDIEKNYDDLFFVKEIKDEKPLIYLYNTHQGEKYLPSKNSDFTPSIMTATSYLNEKLNHQNLRSMMEYKSVSKVLSENNWKYGYSYRVSRMFINEAVKDNPSIKYLFDIHRDSGKHEQTTLCANGKCYAKLLFLVGLENQNYKENNEYAEKLSFMVNSKLEGLSKGILQKKGKNVNGVYNQDFSSRTILIEIGGENNTIDEVYNSVDILSEVIKEFIESEINNGK